MSPGLDPKISAAFTWFPLVIASAAVPEPSFLPAQLRGWRGRVGADGIPAAKAHNPLSPNSGDYCFLLRFSWKISRRCGLVRIAVPTAIRRAVSARSDLALRRGPTGVTGLRTKPQSFHFARRFAPANPVGSSGTWQALVDELKFAPHV